MPSDLSNQGRGDLPRLAVNTEQAAAMLGISERKLWELRNSGEVHSVRIGRSVRFRPEDLQAFLDRNIDDAMGGGR